jgi:hypothetical protein
MTHFPNTVYLLYARQECRVCSKNSNKCKYRYSRCYPLEKIVSDDSWHIPGFHSTLSNCWTQTSLVAERLNGYSRVCFSQAGFSRQNWHGLKAWKIILIKQSLKIIGFRKTLWYQSEARYGHVKVQDNLVYSIPITIRPNKMFNIIWRQLFIF